MGKKIEKKSLTQTVNETKPIEGKKLKKKEKKVVVPEKKEEKTKEIKIKQEKNEQKTIPVKKLIKKDKAPIKNQEKVKEIITKSTEKVEEIKIQKKSIIKTNEKKIKSKLNRFDVKKVPEDIKDRGVVYVAHLPYGWVEEGIKDYFTQYGEVLNVKLARSKKTARSKGYAWVEFKYKEVAEIAANSINNYVLQGKSLQAHVVDNGKPSVFVHKLAHKKYKFIDWKKKFRNEKNKEKSQEELKKHVEKLLKHEEEKKNNLKEMGINYDFPGFKSQIDSSKPIVEEIPEQKQKKKNKNK